MLSTTSVSTTGGSSRWVTIDSMQPAFGVGLGVSIAYGASTPNYTVQHTFDAIDGPARQVVLACTSNTTVTVTDNNHGLTAGDCVIITGAANGFNGTFDVATVTNANTYTYVIASSATYNGTANLVSARVYPHAVLASQSARADGNYAFPIYACRVKLNSGTGTISLSVMQGTGI